MPGRVEGKVAFITGAGRGQGRGHAVKLAAEGADIIAIDICHDVEGALPMATPDDLAETVKLVEARDRRIIATQADVRDLDGLTAAVVGQHHIRVNSVLPTNVNTPMFMNEGTFKMFRPDLENPTAADVEPVAAQFMHVLPHGWIEPEDVSNAVLFLASDESRYITGVPLPVDLGALLK